MFCEKEFPRNERQEYIRPGGDPVSICCRIEKGEDSSLSSDIDLDIEGEDDRGGGEKLFV
jgi:hypothetical protein